MRLKHFIGTCLLVLTLVPMANAQKVAIKNNLVYDALRTPSLSLEFALEKKWTLDTQVGMNWFLYERRADHPRYVSKKWSHWSVRPELRYWFCESFNAWNIGLHALGGEMNVGGVEIPYFILQNKDGIMKNHRYEGYFYGGGISVGYQWLLSNRWSFEASVGIGYARVEYEKFRCTTCGASQGKGSADYVGPTKAALSLIFFLK